MQALRPATTAITTHFANSSHTLASITFQVSAQTIPTTTIVKIKSLRKLCLIHLYSSIIISFQINI